jgi:hypothetical protein
VRRKDGMMQLEFQYKTCEHCGKQGARIVGAMTAFYWDGTGENPNRSLLLCDECENEYCEYWQEMWNEYYSGRL